MRKYFRPFLQNCEERMLRLSYLCLSVRLSVGLSVCLSVPIEQFGSQWTNVHKILHKIFFPKYVEKIQDSLKSGKNNRYFYVMIYVHV